MKLGVAKSRRVKTAGGKVGQWWTPGWLAQELVRWARVSPGMRVLDAGAGMGALSLAASYAGAAVTAVEVDQRLAGYLVDSHYGEIMTVSCRDFLEPRDERQLIIAGADARPFDLVLSNPVWEGDVPERFMIRALELAPRAAFIVPVNLLAGGKRSSFWRGAPVQPTRAKVFASRPKFLGAKGGMRDVMLLEVVPRSSASGAPVRLELEVG